MSSEKISLRPVVADSADRIASDLNERHRTCGRSSGGVDAKAASVFGWTTWPGARDSGRGFVILQGGITAGLFWLEPDAFNSDCLQIPQARLHWVLNPEASLTKEALASTAEKLFEELCQSERELIAVRVFGHNPIASEIFHRSGFRMLIGNAWLYRQPEDPLPVAELPPNVRLEFRELKAHPFAGIELSEALTIACENPFADRFSLDSNIAPEQAARRFSLIVENALTGKIADFAAIARIDSKMMAVVFFGWEKPAWGGRYPLAGRWLTAIAHPSLKLRSVSYALVSECMRRFPHGKAHWTCACALNHFASLRVASKLGFRFGAVAYDYHWWREDRNARPVQ